VNEPRPAGQRRQLVTLAVALVLAMSTWFSTAAVLGQLREAWGLSRNQASWLTIVVQLGFVAGAVVSATSNLADRIAPLRLVLIGAVGAAAANTIVALADGFALGLAARFVTGAFLAAVYPPALKAMSSWYRTGRGFALGVMIGALTLGSALPHLVNGIGGLDWRVTLAIASVLTVVGGLVAALLCAPGPYTAATARFDPTQLGVIFRNREFRLASAGYFGHMWELYAMWAWMAAFYTDALGSSRQASFAAFAVIGIGATGSIYAGLVSDRRSRPQAAALAMRWSASVAVVMGFLLDAPKPIVIGVGLVWGFWVVADSAQFSTIVTEVTDARYVGTALTVQLATGFVLTVFTIFLVPVVRDAHGWGWAFLMLAPGPMLGVWAMRALRLGATPEPVV
jgi:MFS family permease